MTDRPPSPGTRRRPTVDGESIAILVTDDRDDDDRSLPVDETRWAALAAAVLRDEGLVGPAELTVSFVGEPAMADLNERFLGESYATDVLAFPLDALGDDAIATRGDVPRLLGDVVICPSVADRNAPDHAGTYDDELALLLVHGILHVVGMDHDTDAARAAMQEHERAALQAHHGELARDPWR